MQVQETKLKDCFIIAPKVFKDDRGYFFESFNQQTFEQITGQNGAFVQDNQSSSEYGVIRGLHLQTGIHAQAKLVRVLSGVVLDVAVDMRKSSPTFGEWVAVELTAENNKQLYVPRGFAHGFSVLSEQAVFAYKCDNFYHKAAEAGIRYDDPTLGIDWKIPAAKANVSEKDILLGNFASCYSFE
jgi:dTDP-4-dehydrorhamnose 3,5-epimerase